MPRHKIAYRKPKDAKKTLQRVFRYMLDKKRRLTLVAIFILISSFVNILGTYLLKPIINNGIIPLIGSDPQTSDFTPLIKMVLVLIGIYLIGAFSSYMYSRLMITVSNSTLNTIRKELFDKLQDLPIKYFDTHTHGELMSRFTNDVDTLREAISNSVIAFFTSGISVVGTFLMMIVLSPILTIFIVLMIVVIFFIIKLIGRKSAMYFKQQQKVVGEANGYIEEMIEGLKVVKVFNYEEKAKEEYGKLNENLRKASTNANTFASILMPIMGNLSYLNYACTAVLGAILVINNWMDIGSVASFCNIHALFPIR